MAEVPLRRLVLPVAVLALLLWQAPFALRVLLSDPLYFSAQREVVFWGQEEFRPEAARIAEVRQWLETALRHWPAHPDYLVLQARVHIWQGLGASDRSAADEQFRLAIADMEAALAVRPGNPYSWALYAEYLKTQPARAADLELAIRKVALLGPGDPSLQRRMQALTGG